MEALLAKQTAEIKLHTEQQIDALRQWFEGYYYCTKTNETELQSQSSLIARRPLAHAHETGSATKLPACRSYDKQPDTAPEEGAQISGAGESEQVAEVAEVKSGMHHAHTKFFAHSVKYVVEGGLDLTMGVLVILNSLVIIVQSQALGQLADASLGLASGAGAREVVEVCDMLERVFVFLYVIELLIRIAVLRKAWLWDDRTGAVMKLSLFDAFIVCAGTVDVVVPWFTGGQGISNLTAMRLLRFVRLPRTFRIMRVFALFRHLRVLAMTFIASLGALFWSMFVLIVYMFIGSLILLHALHEFVVDEGNDLDTRLWVNSMYGSASKSMYTMFEVTNSGGWPGYSRPLIEKVSPWFAVFFCLYVTIVIFGTIRIITALFIKETLNTAANDSILALQENARLKDAYKHKLQVVFEEADVSGNGTITLQEFEEALENDTVCQYLSMLEVEVHEIQTLWGLLDDGDGEITISEFCQGIMRLKGQARTLDVISIMHDAHTIMAQCDEIKALLVKPVQTTIA
eukprot:TRINITY_DN78519_c0_g1_i1.p1 TRINITY_DN78519_c0_g1~~TRINITY_DN78519_c0_g1_i1.p1  ORF type:complete len:540 (-),score=76.89 TRINITY_DN78519_c0_g1_i1:26-1573(-)